MSNDGSRTVWRNVARRGEVGARPGAGWRRLIAALLAASTVGGGDATLAQVSPPKSYSDYYSQQRKQTHSSYMTPRQYTYNKYFYQNPAVSPYSNLLRPTSPYVPKYQTYVQPEIQRRAATPQSQPYLPGSPNTGALQPRLPTGTQYHNKYYANRGQLPR